LVHLRDDRIAKIIFGRGESKGRADGTADGKADGKADSLERLLRHRFGPLPDWASARIAAAKLSQLDAWLDAVLDVDGVEELLGPAP
jgi:hypothetical protein